ncbi:MAG: hydrogenase maturation protease [Sedimentibacter sp.]|uniref:hydrogenase maturation protease n=1 Tax=Sedimentibacter sp. TaxID=1960295 RepID=UPI003157F43B
MAVKCIAMGNRIMGDDGIGVRAAEELSSTMSEEGIIFIFGETDADYSLRMIEDGDFLFIIDAAYTGAEPGTVTFNSIRDFNLKKPQFFSQHQPSLIDLLKIYEKKTDGFIIGIEAEKIEFGLELSSKLKNRFPHICEEVLDFICLEIKKLNDK